MSKEDLVELCERQMAAVQLWRKLNELIKTQSKILSSREEYLKTYMEVIEQDHRKREEQDAD